MKIMPIFLLVALAACSQAAVDNAASSPMHFAQGVPWKINVAQVAVDAQYASSRTPPHVEAAFPLSPAQAVDQWAHERLQAAGNTGRVTVVIQDASVVATPLPKQSPVAAVVTPARQQSYQATIRAVIRVDDGLSARALAQSSVEVTRTRTLKENATPVEREVFYTTLLRDLMAQFDTQATTQMRQYFTAYLL